MEAERGKMRGKWSEAGWRCEREREEWEVNGWETKSEWMGCWVEGDEDGDDGEKSGSGWKVVGGECGGGKKKEKKKSRKI